MKKLTLSFLLLLFTITSVPAQPQKPDAHDKLKKHINEMVEQVHEAETAVEKRNVLNHSFDNLIATFDKVRAMEHVSQSDKDAIADFKDSVLDKKNELNGTNGFNIVPDTQLDEFADYVQQDFEQADRAITISLTTALLIIIILLLL